MNQSEWFDKIEKLSNKKGVKKIAVQNFLASIGSNPDKMSAMMNAEMDAGMYGWNSATQGAIYDGISIYFDKVKTGESYASEDFLGSSYDKHFRWEASMDQDDYICNHCGEYMHHQGLPLHSHPQNVMHQVAKDHLKGHGIEINESYASESPFSGMSYNLPDVWTCPTCSQQINFSETGLLNSPIRVHLESHGFTDDQVSKIMKTDTTNFYDMNRIIDESYASEDSLVKIEDDDDKDTKVTVLDEWENETNPDVGGDVEGLDQDQEDSRESWSRKSFNQKVEALEAVGFRQGKALRFASLAFEDFSEDLQNELANYTEEDAEDEQEFIEQTREDEIEAGLIDEVDYNNIGESRTARSKYECEFCNCGFKSNESLTIHYNDLHAIPPAQIDGYENWKEVADDLYKKELAKLKKRGRESVASEWGMWAEEPKRMTPDEEADYLRNLGIDDKTLKQIGHQGYHRKNHIPRGESYASEDVTFADVELLKDATSLEDLWNRLSINQRINIITSNGLGASVDNWQEIEDMARAPYNEYDSAFHYLFGGMNINDVKKYLGIESVANEDDYKYDFKDLTSLAQDKIESSGVTQSEWDNTPEEEREELEKEIREAYNPSDLVCPECGDITKDDKEFDDHISAHRFNDGGY